MSDWADDLVTKLLDNTPELKQVSLREIMAMALRDERSRCAGIADSVGRTRIEPSSQPFGAVMAKVANEVGSHAAKVIGDAIRSGQ